MKKICEDKEYLTTDWPISYWHLEYHTKFLRSENTPPNFERGYICSWLKDAALFCAKNSLFEVLKLKHPPPHLLRKESRGKVSSYVARQFFRFLRGVMEPELGGEFAWLKILIIGRTKGVYPANRRTIWER